MRTALDIADPGRPRRARVPLESEIQRSILTLLALRGVYARRINVGMIPVYRTGDSRGFRKSEMTGISDIIGVLPGGRILCIECKRPGGKPTPAQREFLDRVNEKGGLAMVATSTRDVEEALARSER